MNDTIIAPTTTYGKSSLNVLRLSGKKALEIASKLTHKDIESFTPRYAFLSNVYFSDHSLLDTCIIIYFKAPHSYTTEDVVEFQCHGGTFIAQSLLNECISLGARLANPGEFTKRAFLGGRIDLSQAQAIAKLIEIQNATAHKMLMRHLKGEMHDFCESLRTQLITILAHSEVFIDYADEDLPKNLMDDLTQKLNAILRTLSNLLEQSHQKYILLSGLKLCIIGKPNVGKSSLLNALLRKNRAIISDIAGTTRDSIEENFLLGGHLLKLIDTAGIRESEDIIEKEGIKRSIQNAKESDLLLAVFDYSKVLDNEDMQIISLLQELKNEKKILVLINKTDLDKKIDTTKLEIFNPLFLSLKEENKEDENSSLSLFKQKLEDILNTKEENDTLLLTSQYQFQAINSCIEALKDSKTPLQNGELEIFSFHINEAIKAIASITKPYEYSQMLDVMFGDFCLGK
ncbi:tRNA uridine-5-carboxymethylaminomethyl(34) synthesis GTPase MnmE [Helicobacter burdigaliensis]|uniref:tRNA uridine-5-carboxymethylaminomethyl(34) synthesis GTPase MnmE n=1 Tax=Helicobacter burdigaliensis TaxID=2315334 RepID=UPI000EF7165F|nr:tRNA uridine-5-carboxymethylaminomethyl(34) synthesis GTPase MnmE [Helicobacter burdigaliensis]